MSDVILLTLGRWSVGVQLGIVCLLALFFATLVRTVKLEEFRAREETPSRTLSIS